MTPMMLLAMALLLALAAVFFIVPMLRFRGAGNEALLEQRRQANREVFRQRQEELAREAEEGLVSPEEVERLRTEAKRAFLRDMEALEKEQVKSGKGGEMGGKRGRLLPILGLLLVPLISLVLYSEWGSHRDLALPRLYEEIAAATDAEGQEALFNELTEVLQERFDRNPDDLQNGYMLGTLYQEFERYDQAERTFRRMLEQMEENADKATVFGQLARTLYMANDAEVNEEVERAMQQALALNPNQFHVMEIMAGEAFQRRDFEAALGYWRRQLAAATPGSRDAQQLRQIINMVEENLPQTAAGSAAPEHEEEAAGPEITVTIDVDPALRDALDGMQSLFIYVRNPDMRPPLLAQNIPVPEFPHTVTLDNSMSMTGMTLESAPTLIVGARLSATGNAIAQSGDLQAVSEPFVLEELDGPLHLTIDQPVP